MSNNWLFFPSPAAATEKLIAYCGGWQALSNGITVSLNNTVTSGPYGQKILTSVNDAISISHSRTSNFSYFQFQTIAQNTAFRTANSGVQGWMFRHRGINGTLNSAAQYYLGIGTFYNGSWTGQYATLQPTKRWIGTPMPGAYNTTNPTDLLLLPTIDLEMAASITSVGGGSPPQDAYTGGMTSTTVGTMPTGISSLQHRTYGMGFIFGTNAQRNTFVGNYPNDVGTWYVGLGDSLSFTKPGWTWDLNVGGTTNRAYISVANHEVWHAPNTFAVGDDVQIIHTA